MVAAVGTDLSMLTTEFETELTAYGYTTHSIRLSNFLAELGEHDFTGLAGDQRLWAAMDAGNDLWRGPLDRGGNGIERHGLAMDALGLFGRASHI